MTLSTEAHVDDVSERILAAAEALLEEGGIDGIQVREVAERAKTSTMGVYSRFGGKSGLLDRLYVRGFERLVDAAEPIRGASGPAEELERMAEAYRAHAHAWPRHYDLMFGRGVPGFEPSAEARAAALAGFHVWLDSVKRATEAGVLGGRPEENAFRLWALNHGYVSLELIDMAPKGSERALRQRHRAAFRAFLMGLETAS
jgi:AcrR family transcriptional regulator